MLIPDGSTVPTAKKILYTELSNQALVKIRL